MIIDLHIPCYVDQYFPDTALNMVRVLEAAGCAVNYNVDQTCCGLPAFYDGYHDACKEAGTKLIKEFQHDRYVVSCGTACTDMIRNLYSDLFHNSVLHNEYKALRGQFYEFTEFLVEVMRMERFQARFDAVAVFQGACTAPRGTGDSAAHRLLAHVGGLNLLDFPDTVNCCGWGGTFAGRNEELAVRMAEDKAAAILETGATHVISNEWGCLMHLKNTLAKKQKAVAGGEPDEPAPLQFAHIADILATGLI
jgi:L-lactate dehydrogenase complex protein LldE